MNIAETLINNCLFIKTFQALSVLELGVTPMGLIAGNKITSLILLRSERNMTNLSIPIPQPDVGGSAYSKDVQNTSSIGHASSSPASFAHFGLFHKTFSLNDWIVEFGVGVAYFFPHNE